jgi:hypothetical protein
MYIAVGCSHFQSQVRDVYCSRLQPRLVPSWSFTIIFPFQFRSSVSCAVEKTSLIHWFATEGTGVCCVNLIAWLCVHSTSTECLVQGDHCLTRHFNLAVLEFKARMLHTCIWRLLNMLKGLILTLNPLTWKIWWAPNNASRWQMGLNLAFKGLIYIRDWH